MDSTTPSRSGLEQDGRRQGVAAVGKFPRKSQRRHSLSTAVGRIPGSRAAWRADVASAGDHPLIHQFLVSVFHQPSVAEYQAQLEEPSYEPGDRLVIRDGSQIVAHLKILHREMRFGQLVLPVGIITDLATLPEYRRRGCATSLLAAARRTLLRDGAVLGLLATDQPRFYVRRGWVVSGRHCYSASAPRKILSHLKQREMEWAGSHDFALKPRTRKRYNIRLWRHVEVAALMRLYDENTCAKYGNLVRSHAYWRWLVSRGGNQRIYVAINGPDKFELDELLAPIVGYAATREGRIVEIMNAADHPEASVQLLARACGDAIERDFLRVRLDAPEDQPLHQLLLEAGGQYSHHEADQGVVFMTHIFKPRRLLKCVSHELARRAQEAGLPCPCQLGLLVQNEKYRLCVNRSSAELVPGNVGRSYLTCSAYEFHQLLLGHLDVREAVAAGRLTVSTHVALDMAAALFPRVSLWRPPWDNLLAE